MPHFESFAARMYDRECSTDPAWLVLEAIEVSGLRRY